MLPHYSPLKVAETFSSLSGLHPERIDLGLGRAPGTDPMTMLALQRDRRHAPGDDFIEQLVELLGAAGGPAAAQPPVRPPRRHAARPARAPRAVAARLLAAERALGRRSWGCRTRSPTSSTRKGAAIAADYRGRFVDSERLAGPARVGGRDRDLRGQRRGGRAARGVEPDDAVAAAPGPPDRDPAGREGAALPRDALAGQERPARGDRLAGDRCGRASRRWPRSTAPRSCWC